MERHDRDVAQFLAEVDELLELPAGTTRKEQKLADCQQWDSMAVLGLLAIADEKHGVSIKPMALAECKTFGDVFELLAKR